MSIRNLQQIFLLLCFLLLSKQTKNGIAFNLNRPIARILAKLSCATFDAIIVIDNNLIYAVPLSNAIPSNLNAYSKIENGICY